MLRPRTCLLCVLRMCNVISFAFICVIHFYARAYTGICISKWYTVFARLCVNTGCWLAICEGKVSLPLLNIVMCMRVHNYTRKKLFLRRTRCSFDRPLHECVQTKTHACIVPSVCKTLPKANLRNYIFTNASTSMLFTVFSQSWGKPDLMIVYERTQRRACTVTTSMHAHAHKNTHQLGGLAHGAITGSHIRVSLLLCHVLSHVNIPTHAWTCAHHSELWEWVDKLSACGREDHCWCNRKHAYCGPTSQRRFQKIAHITIHAAMLCYTGERNNGDDEKVIVWCVPMHAFWHSSLVCGQLTGASTSVFWRNLHVCMPHTILSGGQSRTIVSGLRSTKVIISLVWIALPASLHFLFEDVLSDLDATCIAKDNTLRAYPGRTSAQVCGRPCEVATRLVCVAPAVEEQLVIMRHDSRVDGWFAIKFSSVAEHESKVCFGLAPSSLQHILLFLEFPSNNQAVKDQHNHTFRSKWRENSSSPADAATVAIVDTCFWSCRAWTETSLSGATYFWVTDIPGGLRPRGLLLNSLLGSVRMLARGLAAALMALMACSGILSGICNHFRIRAKTM